MSSFTHSRIAASTGKQQIYSQSSTISSPFLQVNVNLSVITVFFCFGKIPLSCTGLMKSHLLTCWYSTYINFSMERCRLLSHKNQTWCHIAWAASIKSLSGKVCLMAGKCIWCHFWLKIYFVIAMKKHVWREHISSGCSYKRLLLTVISRLYVGFVNKNKALNTSGHFL